MTNQSTATSKEPTRRELDMGNPVEYFIHYLCEGIIGNIVLTYNGNIFEATPKGVQFLSSCAGYTAWSKEDIQRRSSYKLWLISALEVHIKNALENNELLIIEKDVHSPFLQLGEAKR